MTEVQLSLVRTVLKIVGAALATKGVIDAGDVVTLSAAVEAVVGGVFAIVGVVLSHRKHA